MRVFIGKQRKTIGYKLIKSSFHWQTSIPSANDCITYTLVFNLVDSNGEYAKHLTILARREELDDLIDALKQVRCESDLLNT